MALVTTKKSRVHGKLPARFVQRRKNKATHYGRSRISHYPFMNMDDHKIEDFMLYSDPDSSDDEPDTGDLIRHRHRNAQKPFHQRYTPVSYNVSDYLLTRSQGLSRHETHRISEEYGTRHMLTTGMYKESCITLAPSPPALNDHARPLIVDKVFCSQWLDDSRVIMGTKCNKIKIYDTNKHKITNLTQLTNPDGETNPAAPSSPGVYSLEINPSRTLLATAGLSGREVAVYRLPNLEPVCLGHKAHTDGIMDVCWLDDDFLVSGGMDRQLALWRIDNQSRSSMFTDDSDDEESRNRNNAQFPVMTPLRVKKCIGADKVRAIIFNQQRNEIINLTSNAYIHVWDPERLHQIMSRKLPHAMENVCLTQRQDNSLYAVGSKSHFTLLDPRTLHYVKKVSARINGCSVKSLSFHRDILTIGTAVGAVLFFDMRAGKYLESTMNSGRAVMLKCSRGYVHLEEAAMELMPNVDYSPTIYTHCYDHSGTRLFAAGGPLSVSLRGHYAAIWQ